MDILDDEAEFQKFKDYLDYLTEQIFWYLTVNPIPIKETWDQINAEGLEPIFTDMLFDAIVAESLDKQ